MARLKAAGFNERLTLVEHLDELRTRLIVSIAAFAVAIALCFWQNHLLLDIANQPLPPGRVPTTFGVTEPFFTTMTVVAYGAILIAMPVVLFQLSAFVLPALSPGERRIALPLLLMVPVLFLAGVVFSYFVIMPAATKFLLNFNSSEFQILVRARDYYSFLGMTLLTLGLVFQVPIVILALCRIGVITADQLASNRRYAVLVIAIVAVLLPGTDPVTTSLIMLPMLLLFELGIVLGRAFGRRPGDAFEPEPQPSPQGQ
ncbi:MAG: sec-independent protein translocase protein TatC [Solirubrobacterales bacterium]|jgi:sec-independent protein translocase protein TatC|nr:sec-independent protein translocase protein TatC [Solirubrobacterales bacterium]MDX6663294.1 sec-independent protein translocase protein TatC [Solirubrobacterales bacterium]